MQNRREEIVSCCPFFYFYLTSKVTIFRKQPNDFQRTKVKHREINEKERQTIAYKERLFEK